jgi:methyl-accepting chemotaxis protein
MATFFKNLNLRLKLIIFSSITVLLLGIVFVVAFPRIQREQSVGLVNDRIKLIDIMLSRNLANALEFFDNVSAEIVLSSLKDVDHLDFVAVYDFNRKGFSFLKEAEYNVFKDANIEFINSFQSKSDSLSSEDMLFQEIDNRIVHFGEIRGEDSQAVAGYVLTSFEIAHIDEAVANSRLLAILVTLIFIIISSVISYFFSSLIVRPVEQLIGFFREMAEGKGDLTRRLTIDSEDEIGILATQFNRFIETQHSMISDIKNTSRVLDEKIESIETLSNENNELVNELTGMLDIMHTSATQLEYSADMNLDSAKSASEQSEKTISLSVNGQKAVQTSVKQMNKIRSEVNQLENDMTVLHERSKEIQNISDVLKDISDRTTILALNTSIEANKAGEHGSGFLIIANEIHQLADQSMKSLEDINKLTIELQTSLDQSYNVTIATTKRVDEGMTNIEGTGQQIEDSVESVRSNLNIVKDVEAMASDQKSRVNEIVDNITSSVSNITHIKLSIDNTLSSVREQRDHINNLARLMNSFKVSKN